MELGGEESTELKMNDGSYGYGYGFGYDRMAQWSQQETRGFIALRAKLEHNFVHTKRNKNLWELVASKMTEMGYRRTADQCKCKWKNLVARYKETSPEIDLGSRQCPFFDELHALFTDKAGKRAQIDQAEEGICGKRKNRGLVKIAEEWSEEGEGEEEGEEEEGSQEVVGMAKKKKSADKDRLRVTAEKSRANSMNEILEDFFKQQQLIEMQWRESVEFREAERREREREWRDTMERLEKERLLMERAWREREEQRRARQDARADNRDALLAALLTKLIRPDM
ncbi:hypothetical protein SUGI_0509680 [Cryptomeria japonica]|uniref:trihelix transcription factor GT-3b n=1 Tax=Cryptomeria japonica TaxID=3369 RepID=UPI002408CAF5|nr:trihelix transcription factor GT-3b [Cryptomeria japonica]GLJ26425.1 hypothetical protein SUGI_0509680 [Cryptomeria japonica]